MKKVLIALSFLLASNTILAANQQIPKDRKITGINVYNSLVFVQFTPGYTSSQGCTRDNSNDFSMDLTTQHGQAMYATLMAAAMAGKKVGFGISGCLSSRPQIYRVDVAIN